jgi:peptide chain release factor 1
MLEKLRDIELRYEDLDRILSDPDILKDPDRYRKLSKERSDLEPIITEFRLYRGLTNELAGNRELISDNDAEIRELAKAEIERIEAELSAAEEDLKRLLIPKDPNDTKNIFIEIRAGTGGEEAALFAADLFRMYSRYADLNGWRIEVMSSSETGGGGFKEIIALIEGEGAFSRLKYESGVHRVQRVPETEAQGRIHTSAVTVAIMPEAKEVEVQIDANDLRIDTYRSTGHGGQSVNTTDSAVRITHIPTNLVVTCQDEKSQHKNKTKAMRVLKARLLDLMTQKIESERSETRKSQVGTGDRSERIRTYNFPQSRVTDHRIGLTIHRLESVLMGNLDEILDALTTHYQAEALKSRAV